MTQEEIQSKVIAFMIERLEYEAIAITPDAELKRDLGMSSLDAVEMAIFIKRTFGFQPERNAIKMLVTLQDLYDYVAEHIYQS